MPSDLHTKVDPDQLSRTSGNIDNSLSSLRQALSTVDAVLYETLLPSWKGAASERFFTRYRNDVIAFNSQINALQEINLLLREAASVYDRADLSARDRVDRLRVG